VVEGLQSPDGQVAQMVLALELKVKKTESIKPQNNRQARINTPEPRDYVLPGLTAGNVGILAGPGGSSKSMYALQAACAVAYPHPGADTLRLNVKHHGPVIFLTAEDDPTELDRRFHLLCQEMPQSAAESTDEELLWRVSMVDNPKSLLSRKWREELEDAADGCRLVVIDTLPCFIPGAEENSNTVMAEVIATVKQIASYTGAAILLLTHHNKGQARGDAGDIRGASALVNGVRYAASMTPMNPEVAVKLADNGEVIGEGRANLYVAFKTVKRNYGVAGKQTWYRRKLVDPEHGVGVLVPADVVPVEKTPTKPAAKRSDDYEDLFDDAKDNVRSIGSKMKREAMR
jgi:RecA-family ATPase